MLNIKAVIFYSIIVFSSIFSLCYYAFFLALCPRFFKYDMFRYKYDTFLNFCPHILFITA